MKRILSTILAFAMAGAPIAAFAEEPLPNYVSEEYTNALSDAALAESVKYDTSAFDGTPGYILQDTFANVSAVDGMGAPSGWDIDKRGGQITGSENYKCQLLDIDENYVVSMSKELMIHKTGKITFEAGFAMENKTESGFYYELTGEGKTVFKIITEGDKLAVLQPDGTTKAIGTYQKANNSTIAKESVPFKVILDMDTKTYDVIYEGKSVGVFPFADKTASQIDRITVSTGKETTMAVRLRYIYMYVNYAVNDTFMESPVGTLPYGWERVGGGPSSSVQYDPNQVYPDTFSLTLDDATGVDSVEFVRRFDGISGNVAFETRFIVNEKCPDVAISVGNGNQPAITVKTTANDLVMGNGTVLKANYYPNLWYTLKVVADTNARKADIYLNYQKLLSDVPFETAVSSFNTISFGSTIKRIVNMRIDDVAVYNNSLPSDYVPMPQAVKPDGDIEVGMQMYSMWNEGNHWGWDWITSWPNRITYLGTYAEGKPEVADWTIKWQVEHGFTYRTEIFSRANANLNQPVKLPTRYHALYNGYLNSQYKDQIKFAAMLCGMNSNTIGGIDDMKQNIIPHFMENFFNQPNYLTYENKPVVFMYGGDAFINIMGGPEKTKEVVDYWAEECKKVGFDGIIFVPSGAGSIEGIGETYAYSYTWQYNGRNSEKQLESNDKMLATGAKTVGSVSMGWGRNPWTEANDGEIFSDPSTTYETIMGLKERMKTNPNMTNMIILTCWDEYGEGHFFCPSRVHGFGYLNAVRNAVTGLGEKDKEDMPTAKAIARMDSLYRADRRALKLVVEKAAPVFVEDLFERSKLQVLAEWDFEKMGNIGEWKVYNDVTNLRYENGALRGNSTARDPGVWVEGLNIPAQDVKMIKITTETAGAGQGQLFYQTSVDTQMGVNGKRFDVSQDSTAMKEYEGFPYTKEKLQGNITAIRWDPRNDGFPEYTDFAVKKIQILGYESEPEPPKPVTINLTYNEEPLKITRSPFTKDGVLYFAVHRPLFEANVKTKWSYAKGTYDIEVDDKVATITNGSNIMKLNGRDVDLGGVVYYEDGNLFAPLRPLLENLGFTVKWNGETNTVEITKIDPNDTYEYQKEADKSKPFSWMFETRGNESWTPNGHVGLLKASKGSLVIETAGTDPQVFSPKINIPAEEYKYLRIRMKNETNVANPYVLFTTSESTAFGGGKTLTFTATANDTEMKEYIINTAEFDVWKGTVTQLRFDPVNPSGNEGVSGKIYIDSIEFLKELPQ